MSDKEKEYKTHKKTLTLSKTSLSKKVSNVGQVRQSFAHGKSKTVSVEVKRKRSISKENDDKTSAKLTNEEWNARLRAVKGAIKEQSDIKKDREKEKNNPVKEEKTAYEEPVETKDESSSNKYQKKTKVVVEEKAAPSEQPEKRKVFIGKRNENRRSKRKLTVSQALELEDKEERTRSLASLRRAREKQRIKENTINPPKQVVREVILPETISVKELASRMAVRSVDVIKTLMKSGMIVTSNQIIDADTAELIISEFGHKIKRTSEENIELSIKEQEDKPEFLKSRAPIVTIMGHVDHGKTSLLDTLRKTDIVAKEIGGITQHIGAYQVTLPSKNKITFLDTPGHAAFTKMRSRGANITDIIIIVIAADDGIMEQTIEAINHAKAANVPIIIAINKIDNPNANASRIKTDLLQHEIIVEEMKGDTLCVEISAKTKKNIDKLEEAILLQSELLELKANPNRPAEGTVIEAKLDSKRGPIATILVQKGTLKIGDIFISGTNWGKIKALIDAHNQAIKFAEPSLPVEILGLNGVPFAGDDFFVVKSEINAKEIIEFRQNKIKQKQAAYSKPKTLEQMLAQSTNNKEIFVLIKADTHGSQEAIVNSLQQISEEEIKILHSGVGTITESDVALASTSNGIIIGFNVKTTTQARELAKHNNIDIKFYSIIYNLIEEFKDIHNSLLSPILEENLIGVAEVRNIFSVSKIGKIAGCFIKEGIIKRGLKVKLLRDKSVIYEGPLKTLKRFKDEVKEVKTGYECGITLENCKDINIGDIIECFEIKKK